MIKLNGLYKSIENDPFGNGGVWEFTGKLANELPNNQFIVTIELTNSLDQTELFDLIVEKV